MKKLIVLLSVAIFAIAIFAFAAEVTKPELRPAQKIMQARVAWLTAMNKNLDAKKFEAVADDADKLAAQTKKVGDNLPNPPDKELTLAISLFAKDISIAAAKKDGSAIKVKLAAIKGKCDECHAKLREKK
jgi:hypothetical protein